MIFKPKVKNPLEEVSREASEVIKLTSVFGNGERIPVKYTCDGDDVSPPLKISNVPSEARELVLVMYDPDAPIGTFYHWLLYRIPPSISELPENIPKQETTQYGYQGVNDFGDIGYGGPCPPPGHGPHRYYFLLIAVRKETGLKPRVDISKLMSSVKGSVIGYGVLMGVYSR